MRTLATLLTCLAVGAVVVAEAGADVTKLSLSVSESSPYEYVTTISGVPTLYYAPTGSNSGSFTVTATAKADLGVKSVEFPSVFESDEVTDKTSPYEVTYDWTSSSTDSGAKQVTATEKTSDKTKDTNFSLVADKTAPTGQTVTLSGGPGYPTASVPLVLNKGTDSGAGVDSSTGVVERASATLAHGTCGTFGTFAAVSLSGSADTTVATGNCYRYQYKVADNVGNLSTASAASADAMVDTTAPSTPGLSFSGLTNATAIGSTVYYRPNSGSSFTVAAVATDDESGVASYAFSTPSGFTVLGSGATRTFGIPADVTTSVGPLSVSATNGTGLASPAASFTLQPDTSSPTVAISCNARPCHARAYAKGVKVRLWATDTGGSGLATIRYTFDGTAPTRDHGAEYEGPFILRSRTVIRARAFDRVGNASSLVGTTVRSLAEKLVFAAPPQLTAKASGGSLVARVSSSHQAIATATITGPGLKKPHTWRFVLTPGASLVRFQLPHGVLRKHSYRLVWTIRAGPQTVTKTTRVTLH